MSKRNFQSITNFVTYIMNIQSYQNTNKITFHSNSLLFACFSIALECCKCERMRFHSATVLVVLSICAPRGNIADDAMQMDVNKSLYPFYTTKQMPHVSVTITKKRFFGSNSQVSWASAEIFPRGQSRHFAYPLQVADDAMQMHVHKTLYLSTSQRKCYNSSP